jgi:hypothetical protein
MGSKRAKKPALHNAAPPTASTAIDLEPDPEPELPPNKPQTKIHQDHEHEPPSTPFASQIPLKRPYFTSSSPSSSQLQTLTTDDHFFKRSRRPDRDDRPQLRKQSPTPPPRSPHLTAERLLDLLQPEPERAAKTKEPQNLTIPPSKALSKLAKVSKIDPKGMSRSSAADTSNKGDPSREGSTLLGISRASAHSALLKDELRRR